MTEDYGDLAWGKIKRLQDENRLLRLNIVDLFKQYGEMQEEVFLLRKENEELNGALESILRVLGPSAPTCEGCSTEIAEALKIIKEVL